MKEITLYNKWLLYLSLWQSCAFWHTRQNLFYRQCDEYDSYLNRLINIHSQLMKTLQQKIDEVLNELQEATLDNDKERVQQLEQYLKELEDKRKLIQTT